MELTKPQRRTNIFDYWNVNKKRKSIEEPKSLPRKSITRLEDLANELFYELFNYLDVYDTYKGFYSLNIRLQSLLTNSTLPLKINISSISKPNFQRYHRHIIMPNKYRITSMHLSNPFVVDFIFSPVRITSHFTRLETLIFDNIKSKYLVNILHHLASLPNLSSLIIIPIDCSQNRNDIYYHIFRLPVLKYLKVTLKERFESDPLPMSTNITSPIEHLVINHLVDLNHLNALLSYVPQLRRLTFSSFDKFRYQQPETFSIVLSNLTHVSVKMIYMTFDRFEPMIRNLFNQLQVLRISTNNDREYLNANRWEQLILSFMPHLRIFDFHHTNFVENDDDIDQAMYDSVINEFRSSFWHERKWFFTYHFYLEEYRNRVIFYSINPYRRKQYTLYKPMVQNARLHHQRSNMDVVNHLHIQGEEAMTNCRYYFRNVTKLTLSDSFGGSRAWLGFILKRMVSLNHLTTLVIEYYGFSFEQFIKLLQSTPNIHTLTYNYQSISETNSMAVQQSEMFRLVSNTNRIINLTIKERYSSENIKLLIALCSRIQYLTIDISAPHFESILQFILLKSKTDIQELCSLCVKNTRKAMVGILKNLIESEELLDNYVIKYIGSESYLWWFNLFY